MTFDCTTKANALAASLANLSCGTGHAVSVTGPGAGWPRASEGSQPPRRLLARTCPQCGLRSTQPHPLHSGVREVWRRGSMVQWQPYIHFSINTSERIKPTMYLTTSQPQNGLCVWEKNCKLPGEMGLQLPHRLLPRLRSALTPTCRSPWLTEQKPAKPRESEMSHFYHVPVLALISVQSVLSRPNLGTAQGLSQGCSPLVLRAQGLLQLGLPLSFQEECLCSVRRLPGARAQVRRGSRGRRLPAGAWGPAAAAGAPGAAEGSALAAAGSAASAGGWSLEVSS